MQPSSSLPEHQLQPSSPFCCNYRDGKYFLHRLTRKLGSTATSTVIRRLLPFTNYISGVENETQRALLGHTNGNILMRSSSAAAMLTMVAAGTIVRFPPVVPKVLDVQRILRYNSFLYCIVCTDKWYERSHWWPLLSLLSWCNVFKSIPWWLLLTQFDFFYIRYSPEISGQIKIRHNVFQCGMLP